MATNLQALRKSAGYRTAKDFAETAGIPVPSYTRYEQDPRRIPLERCWIIADKLNCSIDAVVGRKAPEPENTNSEFQRCIEELSIEDKDLLREIAEVLRTRAEKKRADRRAKEDLRFGQYASFYERLFSLEMASDPALADNFIFGSDSEKRKLFKTFVTERAEAKEREKTDSHASVTRTAKSEQAHIGPHAVSRQGLSDSDTKTIAKIMDAYDKEHSQDEISRLSHDIDSLRREALPQHSNRKTSELDRLILEFGELIASVVAHQNDRELKRIDQLVKAQLKQER